MQALDLKNFVWNKDNRWYIIIAVTDFEGQTVVVYREAKDTGKIQVASMDRFCSEFDATYEIA